MCSKQALTEKQRTSLGFLEYIKSFNLKEQMESNGILKKYKQRDARKIWALCAI